MDGMNVTYGKPVVCLAAREISCSGFIEIWEPAIGVAKRFANHVAVKRLYNLAIANARAHGAQNVSLDEVSVSAVIPNGMHKEFTYDAHAKAYFC
jgi:hypothetical protein